MKLLIFVLLVLASCSTTPQYTEFTVSTCPPYCGEKEDYSHCDEVTEDEEGNKICTKEGRWP